MAYTVHQAKAQFSKLLREAEAGKEVIVMRGSKPVAKIVPISSTLLGAQLLRGFESRESSAGFSVVAFTTDQAIASGLLPRHHRDPFDRILAVQALDMGIPIVGRDKAFDLYGVQRIWG